MRIQLFTLDQVAGDPTLLAKFEDPDKFVASCGEQWIQRLKSNPHATGSDPVLVLALDGQRVVGRLGMSAGAGMYKGQPFRTFWMEAFFLNSNYVSTGVGGLILLRSISACKSLLACGAPSATAEKLYQACGVAKIATLKRHVYFYRAKPIIQRLRWLRLGRRFLASAALPVLRLYYSARSWFLCRATPLRFCPVERFDARLDELLAGQTGNFFPRGSHDLNWAMSCRQIRAFEIFRADQLIGYCLLTRGQTSGGVHQLPEMSLGSLLDYYLSTAPGDSPAVARADKSALLRFAVEYFRKAAVDLFECQVFDDQFAQLCRAMGMIHVGGLRVFFRPPPGIRFDAQDPWSLTSATSDVLVSG
jgi:hypothetical protein